MKVFICYRRDDACGVARRFSEELERLGFEPFLAEEHIPPGKDFREHLLKALNQCDVVVAIIGRRWLTGAAGQRRLDDPDDFVRLELETALRRTIPVVPVLIEGVKVPSPDQLPEALEALAFCQAVEVRLNAEFRNDMRQLAERLRKA